MFKQLLLQRLPSFVQATLPPDIPSSSVKILAATADRILEFYQSPVAVNSASHIIAAPSVPTIENVMKRLDELTLKVSRLRASRVSCRRSPSITSRQKSSTPTPGRPRLTVSIGTTTSMDQPEDLGGPRPERADMAGRCEDHSAICNANPIAAAKAKRDAHKSQVFRLLGANYPTWPRCRRAFRSRIALVGHLRTQCAINPTIYTSPTLVLPKTLCSPRPSHHRSHCRCPVAITHRHHPPCPNPALATAPAPPPRHRALSHRWDDGRRLINSNVTIIPITGDADSAHSCPHCDRIFTSLIGLVSHL
ncbi:hypothetical protein SprV_0200731200 [Sparganum proliferum]